ncbi:MAG: protein-L-isoaspartate(D-aspartate) O-methyltransferase [candidate division KSB1 bacterium]|nr:protein-L-isoaspartate(D-aspartate) O-methyltransferase [candidate division KSB1 bacterium]
MANTRDEKFARLWHKMVEEQIIRRGIQDERVIAAMRKVPRHLFVPDDLRHLAYKDAPLPIGENQTISQPYIVAYMTAMLDVKCKHRVLEIGTGSGYQTAILAELAQEVYTVEIIPELYHLATQRLKRLGYTNIHTRLSDGSLGWSEHAPYDRIIVTAAPTEIPHVLTDQLKEGGVMVLPVGHFDQHLFKVLKLSKNRLDVIRGPMVRFVPMTGIAEKMN